MDRLTTSVRLVDSTTVFPLTVSTVVYAAAATIDVQPLQAVKLFRADPFRSTVNLCSTFTDQGLRLAPSEAEAREATTQWPFTGNSGVLSFSSTDELWAFNPSAVTVEQVTFLLEQWSH